jgi:hyaluronan synthase
MTTQTPAAATRVAALGEDIDPLLRAAALVGLVFVLCLVAWHIWLKAKQLSGLNIAYTVVVSSYVLSRFAMAAFYRQPRDARLEPEVAVIVPAYNEGAAVATTIDACMAVDYPREKMEMVVINDGSTDDTWEHMTTSADRYPEGVVRCIDLGSNKGKRAAMAAGIRATSAEILLFVDSDSVPAVDGVRKLVQVFVNPKVGAASGITFVRNAHVNALTKMQQARYYVSFQLLKCAEAVVGAVACNPGCFSAYRRSAVMQVLDRWENQRFLGVACTFGDDRALTNMILRKRWISQYHNGAVAWTEVPEHFKKFFKQQLRWKKSWLREGPILMSHIWRTRPAAFPAVAIQTIAGLLSPFILVYNLFWHSYITGVPPVLYAISLYLIACCYGLLYRFQRDDHLWLWAIVGTFFYISFSPQLIWAAIRIRDTSWGTRGSRARRRGALGLPRGSV